MTALGEFERDIISLLPLLRSLARKYCAAQPHIADDIVQVALLRALEHRDQFEPGTNLRAWLLTIARNEAMTYLARRRRYTGAREEPTEDDVLIHLAGVVTPNQEHHMAGREFEAAFAKLTTDQQETIILANVHGLSEIEMAEHWSIRLGTVKSRVSRARNRLGEIMGVERVTGHRGGYGAHSSRGCR